MSKISKKPKKEKTGHWIIVSNDFIRKSWFMCDRCDVYSFEKKKRCPYCHAKMQ